MDSNGMILVYVCYLECCTSDMYGIQGAVDDDNIAAFFLTSLVEKMTSTCFVSETVLLLS